MSGSAVNIAFVIDMLMRGGAERLVVDLANHLDVNRYQPYIITTRAPGERKNDLSSELLPHVRLLSVGRRTRWDLGAFGRFVRMLERHQIRIVHSHSHTSSYFIKAAKVWRRTGWLDIMHDHHGPVEKSLWMPVFDRLFLRGVDYYYAVSERLASYARRRVLVPNSRCEYLANGVALPSTTVARPNGRFTVVQVGRLLPDKNQLMAIEIASRLRARVPKLQWLLVGRIDRECAEFARRCRESIAQHGLEENVQLLGERTDVSSFLEKAHVGVMTSCYEGLPVSLLEYMAWGLPVVVTDAGECSRVVQPSQGGVVVGTEDVGSFVDALAELAVNPGRRESWGQFNRDWVAQNYSIAAMADRIMDRYDRLLEGAEELHACQP